MFDGVLDQPQAVSDDVPVAGRPSDVARFFGTLRASGPLAEVGGGLRVVLRPPGLDPLLEVGTDLHEVVPVVSVEQVPEGSHPRVQRIGAVPRRAVPGGLLEDVHLDESPEVVPGGVARDVGVLSHPVGGPGL